MFLSLKTLYRKRTVIWPFYFYTIIRTLSDKPVHKITFNISYLLNVFEYLKDDVKTQDLTNNYYIYLTKSNFPINITDQANSFNYVICPIRP